MIDTTQQANIRLNDAYAAIEAWRRGSEGFWGPETAERMLNIIETQQQQIDRLTRVCSFLVAGDRLAALKVMEES